MRVHVLGLLGATFAVMASGCGQAEPSDSTISGTIAQDTFPSAVKQIVAFSDRGGPILAPVASDGAFTLTLPKGATYHFSLAADGQGTPMVLRNDGGRLQTLITITGGGASVDIGAVRFWAGAPIKALARVQGLPVTPTVPTETGACVNGVFEGTTQPCASGKVAAKCEDVDDDGDGHHGHRGHHGDHDGPKGDHHGGDHMGATPVVDDPTTDALDAEPMGVPELNLPAGIGCSSGCPGM